MLPIEAYQLEENRNYHQDIGYEMCVECEDDEDEECEDEEEEDEVLFI